MRCLLSSSRRRRAPPPPNEILCSSGPGPVAWTRWALVTLRAQVSDSVEHEKWHLDSEVRKLNV